MRAGETLSPESKQQLYIENAWCGHVTSPSGVLQLLLSVPPRSSPERRTAFIATETDADSCPAKRSTVRRARRRIPSSGDVGAGGTTCDLFRLRRARCDAPAD